VTKTFLIAWIALFVLWMGGSFVVHGVLLSPDYMKVQQLFRAPADSEQYFPWMLLAHVLLAGAFSWIYGRGQTPGKPWLGQGLRYGVAIALLAIVPTYMIYYAVQPMPGLLVVKQTLYDGVLMLVLGVAVAFIYRNAPR
jgi:hypothetical protein